MYTTLTIACAVRTTAPWRDVDRNARYCLPTTIVVLQARRLVYPALDTHTCACLCRRGVSPEELLALITKNDQTAVDMALRAGADPNGISESQGIPPIIAAARRQQNGIVRLLKVGEADTRAARV